MIEVALPTEKLLALLDPNLTALAPVKLSPVTVTVVAPTFVELSEDQAERAVSALAELLAAVVDRFGDEVGGVSP